MEMLTPGKAPMACVTFAWKADVTRLREEFEACMASGCPDPFCLAEMQCSLDLIEADLVTLSVQNSIDLRMSETRDELTLLFAELKEMIDRMIALEAQAFQNPSLVDM